MVALLKNCITFSGRSARKEYWLFVLSYIVFTFVSEWGLENVSVYGNNPAVQNGLLGVFVVGSILLTLGSWAFGSRRLHDIGKSGWNQLWAFTIVGFFYLIYLWVQPSSVVKNQYGSVNS